MEYEIKCEVISANKNRHCGEDAWMEVGETFTVGSSTPNPKGICARAFSAIYPITTAMRFSEEISWEKGKGYYDVYCPDGMVQFRLSRVKK